MGNEVTPEIQALAQKIAAQKAQEIENRKADIAAKYPHADVSTLMFDTAANKFSVEIKCAKCGAKRRVFTSDLFQVKTCVNCAKEAKAEAKAVKGELVKRALALIASGQVPAAEAASAVDSASDGDDANEDSKE